jgi:TolA-binding protein
MDSVDKLLAELKATHQSPVPPPPVSQTSARPVASLDDLLSQLGEDQKRSVRSWLSHQPPVSVQPSGRPSELTSESRRRSPEDLLLAQLKSDYEAHDRVIEQQRQQELQAAEQQRQRQERDKQRRLDQLRQQRRAELAQQAEAWLKQLSPRTEEGLWFEEFACSYESRREAAIDYLEALQEVNRG